MSALAEASALLHREARLLDETRFEEWLGLFTPDGIYWIPSRRDQIDPRGVASIVYEDRAILALRVERLAGARAHALSPMPRTTHLVGNIEMLSADEVASVLIVVEHRNDRQRLYSGRCRHRLQRVGAEFRIALKRVDLADCEGILAPISILL